MLVRNNKIAQIYNNKIHWVFETNETLEEVKARFAPDMVFVDITGLDYMENWDWNADTSTASAPVEIETLTKEEQIAALDEEYESQFTELAQAYATALMANDVETATSIQADYVTLKAEYQATMEVITNG